jgi:hypothetical protein
MKNILIGTLLVFSTASIAEGYKVIDFADSSKAKSNDWFLLTVSMSQGHTAASVLFAGSLM